MDTLVFLCQHTCTMVLPRWGLGLSGAACCRAVVSSSDSTSAKESSGHSEKVRRLLLLEDEQGGEGRWAQTQTESDYSQSKGSPGFHTVYSEYFVTVTDDPLFVFHSSMDQLWRLNPTFHIELYVYVVTYCCQSDCRSPGQKKSRCWFLSFLSPSLGPPSTSPSPSLN